jgi:hypothetical protein
LIPARNDALFALIPEYADRGSAECKKAPAVRKLAKELLEIEATGDRARAETLFARYEKMPEPLKTTLDSVQGVPVDIDAIQDCSAVGLPRCGEDF